LQARTARIGIALAAALVLAVVLAFRGPLLRAGVAAVVDYASGYQIAVGDLRLEGGRALVRDLHVARRGETVLDADSVEIRYRLRDLLPGGAHRYGLLAIALERPRLQIVRFADGSFNVSGNGAAPGGTSQALNAAPGAPLQFAATVRDGSVVLVDPNRVLPVARRLWADGLDGTAEIDSAARSVVRFEGRVASAAAQRFEGAGRIDAGGYEIFRVRAGYVAIAPLADYFINTPSAEVREAAARDVDLRVYTFGPRADGSIAYHVGGTGTLAGGVIHLPGLVEPARDLRGRVDLYDDGLVAQQLRGRVGAVGVRLAGGLYDRADPQFRLGIVAEDAPLGELRKLFSFSRALPLGGAVRVVSLLENAVGDPLSITSVQARRAAYGAIPVENAAGRAVYYDSAVDLVGARGTYGGLAVAADGAIELGDVTHSQLVVDARGPAARIPFLAQIAPDAAVHATALIAGDGVRLDARGVADGSGGGTTLSGVFHVDPDGDGAFGPLRIAQSDGASAAGTFYLNRIASESGFWLDARGISYARLTSDPHLPGLTLAPPVFGGRLDGSLAGDGPPSNFRIAGTARARGLQVAGVRIDEVSGSLAGGFASLRLGNIAARGPWGTFHGTGAYLRSTLALAGAYRGSFTQLRGFTGDLGARGTLDGPVALLISPERTVVQARGERSRDATVYGVPIDGLSGTLAVTGPSLRVYAASARVAGGAFAAAGALEGTRGVGVSVAGADALRLRAIAPLGAGRVAAIGTLRSSGKQARFDGGLAVGGATVDRLPLDANGDVTLTGERLDLRATDAVVGAALGTLSGSLRDLGTRAPRYDVGVHLTTMQLAPFEQRLTHARNGLVGTAEGDARVRGTPGALALSGRLAIPEGGVNGLGFRDGAARFVVTPSSLFVGGLATVGTTETTFGTSFAGGDAAVRVSAKAADLADFNDLFDTGDTLGGTGRVDVSFRKRGPNVNTSADIAIAALRYRRFDLGDATAHWTSRGPNVTGKVAFGGASGRLALAGSLVVPRQAPIAQILERSRFDGTAQLRDLDLGVWLPAVGLQLPIAGRVDADARIAGPLRNPDMRTNVTLVGGSLGRFPVDRLEIATTSTLSRTTITSANLEFPSLSVTGSGSFGLGARDPLTLALHAKSPDIGAIAARLRGSTAPLTGEGEVDLKVGGTRSQPRVTGGFDLEGASLGGVAIPQALGEFSLAGRDLVLSDAEIGFAKGTLYLAGSVPLEVEPLGFGPAPAPITLDLRAQGIDLANFKPLLPEGSTLQGELDGHMALGGTAGNPRLDGSLTLAGGALRAPFETEPLQDVSAQLTFAGDAAKLERLHAAGGGGTLDGSGNVRFANLVHPSTDAAYQFLARLAHFGLDLPEFGSGQIDGTISLTHVPRATPKLYADLALSDATIPFSALLLAAGAGGGGFEASPTIAQGPPVPGGIALDLLLGAERNVRVRSANIDIGARGSLQVSGSTSAPVLFGGFDSTGGTLAYFNTVFRIIDGNVKFEPDLGVIPYLQMRAVTHVLNPDPNTVRNVTGSADVSLEVRGPVTNLAIDLSSDPAYDRQQILGLLLNAPALGASNLFGTTGQPTLYGSTTALPGGVVANRTTGEFSVAQEAFGIANAQFTRTLLAPIESSVAQAVGLTNVAVNVDYLGNVGLTARKVLGKKINAIYGTTFGYPYRQTFGFEFKPNESTAAQVTVFETLGAYGLNSLTPAYLNGTNLKVQAAQPTQGTAGFSLSLQRLF
jgi:autotransporter translocation and assembly factor TamB